MSVEENFDRSVWFFRFFVVGGIFYLVFRFFRRFLGGYILGFLGFVVAFFFRSCFDIVMSIGFSVLCRIRGVVFIDFYFRFYEFLDFVSFYLNK